jgi:hypothetical protein
MYKKALWFPFTFFDHSSIIFNIKSYFQKKLQILKYNTLLFSLQIQWSLNFLENIFYIIMNLNYI